MAIKTEAQSIEDVSIKFPKKYKVILLNDDYTSMEFVIDILMGVFHKNYEEAKAIMLDIHNNGKGVCGVYTYEIAQTKVIQVHRSAKDSGFPLKATMESE